MEIHGANPPWCSEHAGLAGLQSLAPRRPKAMRAGWQQTEQALCKAERREKQAAVSTARTEVFARHLLACPDEMGTAAPALGSGVTSPLPLVSATSPCSCLLRKAGH